MSYIIYAVYIMLYSIYHAMNFILCNRDIYVILCYHLLDLKQRCCCVGKSPCNLALLGCARLLHPCRYCAAVALATSDTATAPRGSCGQGSESAAASWILSAATVPHWQRKRPLRLCCSCGAVPASVVWERNSKCR